jgi:NAD-dependent SIR2 family protein deacetylase
VEINTDATPLTSYADFSIKGKAGEILPKIDKELRALIKSLRN